MKKVIFLPFLFFIVSVKAQLFDTATYFITEARINKVDFSEDYYKNRQFLTFYLNNNEEVCFLNSKQDFDEFSYGKVYDVSVKNTRYDGCKAEEINFRWFYLNSYDRDSGYAFVQLRRIYRENGIEFAVKIISKKLDIIEFAGFSSEMRLESGEEDENNLLTAGYPKQYFL